MKERNHMEYEKFLKVLNKELVVALGCTEPIAIALCAAAASKSAEGNKIISVELKASKNIIKNAMSVQIPGAESCGINLAAALGSLTGNPEKGLELLNNISDESVQEAKNMVKNGIVLSKVAETDKKLYIEVTVKKDKDTCRAVIEDNHTNISLIEVNGQVIKASGSSTQENCEEDTEDFLNIDSIYEFAENVPLTRLGIIKKSIELNRQVGIEGLNNSYGLQVGRSIKEYIDKGILTDDITHYAMALTAAGSDARMAGCDMEVMSNSGSGNQGITATLPVVAACERLSLPEEKLMRAVTLSNLLTIYIKSKFGRLSALCGATIAGTGACCGIVYLLGGGKKEIKYAIKNMLGNVTGMLCDGAKAGCALKVSTCTNAAMQSAFLSMSNICIKDTDGIIEDDIEKTINNVCRLSKEASAETDKVILDIMLNKES